MSACGDAAGQLVRDLSGGQKGRASWPVRLVGYPEVLVLDEPTVGLDPVLRVELWDRFHALARLGTTLIVSSHVMESRPLRPPAAAPRRRAARRLHPAQLRVDGRSDDLEWPSSTSSALVKVRSRHDRHDHPRRGPSTSHLQPPADPGHHRPGAAPAAATTAPSR